MEGGVSPFALTWQRVQLARHPKRPHTLDYIERLMPGFSEIHGDRAYGDDPAIVARWLANKTTENVEKWVTASDSVALVATRAEDMLGFALLTGHELALCYVVPRALFQGAGKALLQSVEKAALARGVEVLTLDSTKTALPFYTRNGFSSCGPVRSWAGLVAQPMTKTLRGRASPKGG